MMARLRRLRILTLLLLAATPGLAGTALQALHPCAVSMPWLAGGGNGGAGHAGHAAGHDHAPDGPQPPQACHCIGACSVVDAPPVAVDGRFVRAPLAVAAVRTLASPADIPVHLPLDRLPPTTAPPFLG